jgi:phosphoribosylglycinamide formyltransferase-1
MKSLVILASGAGSNAEQIIRYLKGSADDVRFTLISDKLSSGVFEIGRKYDTPAIHIPFDQMLGGGLVEKLSDLEPDLIVLAGFLRMIPEDVVSAYGGSIINIHPSLLPEYGGKGMYGEHVHRAVLGNNEIESGITIHYVNEEFDKGAVIAQFHCALSVDESLESLKKKIQKLEHRYFPYVIETLLQK